MSWHSISITGFCFVSRKSKIFSLESLHIADVLELKPTTLKIAKFGDPCSKWMRYRTNYSVQETHSCCVKSTKMCGTAMGMLGEIKRSWSGTRVFTATTLPSPIYQGHPENCIHTWWHCLDRYTGYRPSGSCVCILKGNINSLNSPLWFPSSILMFKLCWDWSLSLNPFCRWNPN